MAEERTIHLYPYQANMVNRIEKAFESFRSVISSPFLYTEFISTDFINYIDEKILSKIVRFF